MTRFLDNVSMALATLRSNPLRSLLTLLGIVIGASTVVAMMSMTEGLRLKVNSDLSMLGAGAFQVQKWPVMNFGPVDWQKYARRKDLTREQGEAIRGLPHVKFVSIESYHNDNRVSVSTRERSTRGGIQVGGVLPDYEPANGLGLSRGRFINDVDVALGRNVVVLGPDITDTLFPDRDPVGQEVRIRGTPFEVIGVGERKGSIFGEGGHDSYVLMPWPAHDRLLGKANNNNIAIQATSADDSARAQDEVIALLRRVRGVKPYEENDFEIFSNESMTQTFNQLALMVGSATFAVCALALLVGGIGIMNIMLVSVTERTREIGVRKALGARRSRILAQFLFESVTLSLLGGVGGAVLGAALAIAAREIYSVPASVPAWAVILSLASSSGAGLLFGIYPAARASKLDPVEAMRTE